MKLYNYIDTSELDKMVKMGYVNEVHHPNLPLRIYNYNNECMYAQEWNDTTCKCRGLVVDDDENIVARPFTKFFNYEEITDKSIIPANLSYDIYEKMDGSLGIVFVFNDEIICCTRGSFISDQAIHAKKIIDTKYSNVKFDSDKTYLFEIIYPKDVHVINYFSTDDIYLLAVFNNETGEEYDIYEWKDVFPVVKHYSGYDWKTIRNIMSDDNKEGFVVRFENGFRMKIKFEQYFKLHSFKNCLSEKKIFEFVSENNLDELKETIKLLSEETRIWCNDVIDKFNMEFNRLIGSACGYYDSRPDLKELVIDENEVAKISKKASDYYKNAPSEIQPIVFAIANGKSNDIIDKIAWKVIKNKNIY